MKTLRLLNLNCREAARLVSEGMDRRLSVLERIGLRLHLLICSVCRQWRRHVMLMRRVLRSGEGANDAAGSQLTETARQRIREAIESAS